MFPSTSYLSLSDNLINTIECKAFDASTDIKILLLQNNNFKKLMQCYFWKLSHLNYIDLSNNNLEQIERSLFPGLSFRKVEVKTDYFFICCIKHQVSCSEVQSIKQYCNPLLTNPQTIVARIVAVGGILENLLFFLWSQYRKQSINKDAPNCDVIKSFNLFAMVFFAANMEYFFVMLIMSCVNLHYGNSLPFQESSWRNSFLCKVVYSLSISSVIFSSFLMIMITISRYHIVKYPFNTKFKQPEFVNILLNTFCLLFHLLGIICAVFSSIIDEQKQGKSCIPFGNLSVISQIATVFCIICLALSIVITPTMYVAIVNELTRKNEVSFSNNIERLRKVIVKGTLVSVNTLLGWLLPVIFFLAFMKTTSADFNENVTWIMIAAVPYNCLVMPVFLLQRKG